MRSGIIPPQREDHPGSVAAQFLPLQHHHPGVPSEGKSTLHLQPKKTLPPVLAVHYPLHAGEVKVERDEHKAILGEWNRMMLRTTGII